MKKYVYGFLLIIAVSLAVAFFVTQTGPETFSTPFTSWAKQPTDDTVTASYAKGEACYVLIQYGGDGYQDGVVIKTTKKTWFDVWSKKQPVIQWNFFFRNVLGQDIYTYSRWGENYNEETGPEIFPNCEKYLKDLPLSAKEELRKYGAME